MKDHFIFDKRNYTLIIIGLVLIAVGFLLLMGGGSEDPNVFNPSIFDFQRLTLAPLVILSGFIVQIFAIMLKPKSDTQE